MHVELTVRSPECERDVALTAPAQTPLADVLPALAQAVGLPDSASLSCGAHRVADLRTGTVLESAPSAPQPELAGLAVRVVGGPAAGLTLPLDRGGLSIGRAAGCHVVLPDPDVSRRHAMIEVTSTGPALRDLGSTNGTRVDGRLASRDRIPLKPGSFVAIGDSLLTVAASDDVPAAVRPGTDGTVLVTPAPRSPRPPDADEIMLPTVPRTAGPRGVQWLAALLPAAAGGLLAWLADSPQFLLFALLSPVLMIGTGLGDRLHWRRSRRRAAARYRQRQAGARRRIADALAAEQRSRTAAAPDPAAVLHRARLPGSRLWERRRSDGDALHVRLGTADLPSTARVRDGTDTRPAGTVRSVPVSVDLRRGPLGLAGPEPLVDGVARSLLGQLAVLHPPQDVEFAILVDERRAEWAWLRWLPHFRGRAACGAAAATALVADLRQLVEQRLFGRQPVADAWPGRWLVLLLDQASRLAATPGLGALLERGARVGVTAICLDTEAARLPTSCRSVARADGVTGTRLLVRDAGEQIVVADQTSRAWADAVARALAPFRDATADGAGALPPTCGLLDTLGLTDIGPDAVATRWREAGEPLVTLGCGPDGPLTVDLVGDGPHALVAGTTGAGKSELLQTLVASLAVRHPPDEIAFVLVDYKGGAAFAECATLPHVTGVVTDLDGQLTARALRSLNAELRRRERLFAAAGASDLAGYRAAGTGEQLPRLVIVVDEFAALADELPDFVRGLISVAQRGRSLGIHLVLATQRPGGAVSAEIRANTSVRIALRVTDPAESIDVVDAPDAATLDRTTPGRGYLRVGSSLTCFQAAHAGGRTPSPSAVLVRPLDAWRRPIPDAEDDATPTDLARVVDAVRLAAERTGHARARSPWLAPLPDRLAADAVPRRAPGGVPYAVTDLPDEQRRGMLTADLDRGCTLLIVGGPRSGRTGVLLALATGAATALAPAGLHVHVVDATGALRSALRDAPQLGTALGPDEVELVPRLLSRLTRDCAHRTATRESGAARIVLLVDGWEAVLARLPDVDAVQCAEQLNQLLRAGPGTAISVAVTGDRSLLAPRTSAGFGERILLRLTDRADYAAAGLSPRDVPATLPPGRGVRAADGTVLQVVAADPSALASSWPGHSTPDAIRVRPLPDRVRLAALPRVHGALRIGLAGDDPAPLAVDLFAGGRRLLVAGPPRSGRSTLLCSLARQALEAGAGVVAAAPPRSPLYAVARELGVPLVDPNTEPSLPAADVPTLLLVDDSETFVDGVAGDALAEWLRSAGGGPAAVVAGRAEELATTYRGIAADVRRGRCGVLLRPGPLDGELLGVRLPRRASTGPPGRGVMIGEPAWGDAFRDGEPLPVQAAEP